MTSFAKDFTERRHGTFKKFDQGEHLDANDRGLCLGLSLQWLSLTLAGKNSEFVFNEALNQESLKSLRNTTLPSMGDVRFRSRLRPCLQRFDLVQQPDYYLYLTSEPRRLELYGTKPYGALFLAQPDLQTVGHATASACYLKENDWVWAYFDPNVGEASWTFQNLPIGGSPRWSKDIIDGDTTIQIDLRVDAWLLEHFQVLQNVKGYCSFQRIDVRSR
ncbi:hypothetical protein DFS34DRAFT_326608 [Phlyctochytrium arcticum]|nr:hypothetical protein DFS34DRAFT_326608 [Phlyctochytrium arcticum]